MRNLITLVLIFAGVLAGLMIYDQMDARIRSNFEQIQTLRETAEKERLPQLQINQASIYPNAGEIYIETTDVK